uniref:Uncharacterized protein n=1 Tax=Caenorhabditis japonica TaxID=281687 RepID=A0A8R1E6W6_CAEJA
MRKSGTQKKIECGDEVANRLRQQPRRTAQQACKQEKIDQTAPRNVEELVKSSTYSRVHSIRIKDVSEA